MPIGAEAFILQALDGTLGEITVLKAAAGQDDALLADLFRDGNDGFGQRVVEPGGDLADGKAALQVGQDSLDGGGPVEQEKGVLRIACCVLRGAWWWGRMGSS